MSERRFDRIGDVLVNGWQIEDRRALFFDGEKFVKSTDGSGFNVSVTLQIYYKKDSDHETFYDFQQRVNVVNRKMCLISVYDYFLRLTYDDKQKCVVANFLMVDEKILGTRTTVPLSIIGIDCLLNMCYHTINTSEKKMHVKFENGCFDDGKSKPSQAFLDYFKLSPVTKPNLFRPFREKESKGIKYQSFFHDDEKIVTGYEVILLFKK